MTLIEKQAVKLFFELLESWIFPNWRRFTQITKKIVYLINVRKNDIMYVIQ